MRSAADDADEHALARVGTVLRGKYRLDRILGVGGMAVVYKATHRNQAEFAVKMLHPELSRRKDLATRFLREGYAANSVKHPGAVAVVDDDVAEDGSAFLVMELIPGVCVEALWENHRNRLPVETTVAIGHQLLDILAAAHAKKIVHRDIKPANLFVTWEGRVKVLDFGIARVRDAADKGNATASGLLMGTPVFMPPEQALAKASEMDGQTDVWAVGATLFTLLSGHFVHEGDNAAQIMVKATTTPARSVSSVMPDVPPAIARVIDRALAFEKSQRWPSAAAMQSALADASREALGTLPSRAALAARLAPARASGGADAPPRVEDDARALGVRSQFTPTAMGPAAGVPRPPLLATVDNTTDQPFMTSHVPMHLSLSRRGLTFALGVPVVIGLLVVAAFGVRALTRTAPPPPVSAATTVPSNVPAVTAGPPPKEAALPSARVAPPAIGAASRAIAHAHAPTPPNRVAPQSTDGAPDASANAAPVASAPKANCDPPYTIDEAGHHKPKPECL